ATPVPATTTWTTPPATMPPTAAKPARRPAASVEPSTQAMSRPGSSTTPRTRRKKSQRWGEGSMPGASDGYRAITALIPCEDLRMPRTTLRVLATLELLQARGRVTGPELARHLGVDPRTVRRYVAALEELGIPVTAERGAAGG